MNAPKLSSSRAPDILKALEGLQKHFHENIKYHVSLTYTQIVFGQVKLAGLINEDEKFTWTKGPASGSPLPGDVQNFINQVVLPYYFELFQEETNREVIERVLENMCDLTDDFGPAVFNDRIEQIVKFIIMFLEKKTFCQSGEFQGEAGNELEDVEENPEDDSEEEEEEDDGIDHDKLIFGNVTDLIISLTRAYGNEFTQALTVLIPQVVLYTSDKHPLSDKSMAIGCLAEVFAAAEGVIPTYFNDYLPLLEKFSTTNDVKMNRHVAYSIGVLAQHAPLLFRPHVNSGIVLLQKLHSNCE